MWKERMTILLLKFGINTICTWSRMENVMQGKEKQNIRDGQECIQNKGDTAKRKGSN